MKEIHELIQGSDSWLQFRAQHFGASESAAMLGLSKTTTRTQLLRLKHTGLGKEFSEWVQANVLDHGHEVEALARPHIEALIGAELYPVTCSDGELSASCDGLTMDDAIAFEHKQWNEALAALVGAGTVPDEHMPQCQQVLMVTGAGKLIFVVSDGTPEKMVYAWVLPDPAWFERIRAGWHQFAQDIATYKPAESAEPAPVGHAPETLPALRIELVGQVTASNLAEFKATALGAIRSVNRELSTDQHFADAKQSVKWCAEVESRIKGAKEHALSQTSTIEALFRTLDDVSAEARRVRLDLEKLVTRREVEIKGELVAGAKAAYEQHETECRQDAGAWKVLMPPDFGAAIKGKRSVDSMRDALDACLANAKIAASEQARKIRANLCALDEESKGSEHLFRDRLTFIDLTPEAVRLMARQRIAEHQAAEERRAAELAERERERIRAEEQAKLAREQEALQKATEAKPTIPLTSTPIVQPAPASQAGKVVSLAPARKQTRPADDEIIDAISLAFRVHESKALEWLLDMDLKAAGARMAAAMA